MAEGFQDAKVEKYDEMFTEAIRLQSFKNWPFEETSICSASKMAEAGFFHCPSDTEPDLVMCYVCFKELDGWVSTDEPWSEHYSHSKDCLFAQLKKPQSKLTIEEIYKIECERKINKTKRYFTQHLQAVRKSKDELKEYLEAQIKSLGGTNKKKK